MPRTEPFEMHHARYEAWFERHDAAYVSELLALRAFVPWKGRGIEIGVGTGRFAAPLAIEIGVDPSAEMLQHAIGRGVRVVRATAEALPFAAGTFDHALVVTTICFVDSPSQMLSEIRRVLKPRGLLVVGFVDRESPLGQTYLASQTESVFYREATFFSAGEVLNALRESGFELRASGQTLAHTLQETKSVEPLRAGHGRCAFVVFAAVKP